MGSLMEKWWSMALSTFNVQYYGGIPVFMDNACFQYRNGSISDIVMDTNFFIAGPFDTGNNDTKSYYVTRFTDSATGGVTPCVRPYNNLNETSVEYWAIGNSSNVGRSINTPGRYLLVSLPKAKAANLYMWKYGTGDYVFKGSNIKTYAGIPIYLDNAYFPNNNGTVNEYLENSNFFIAGPFDTLSTGSKSYTLSCYMSESATGVATTDMRLYNNLSSSSVDFWAVTRTSATRTLSSSGQYVLFSIWKNVAANMYLYYTASNVNYYLFKGNNLL